MQSVNHGKNVIQFRESYREVIQWGLQRRTIFLHSSSAIEKIARANHNK